MRRWKVLEARTTDELERRLNDVSADGWLIPCDGFYPLRRGWFRRDLVVAIAYKDEAPPMPPLPAGASPMSFEQAMRIAQTQPPAASLRPDLRERMEQLRREMETPGDPTNSR